jgi:hypothetical protein
LPPDPYSDEIPDQYLFGLLAEYEMLPENLSGLEQVIAQGGPDVQVLIVEMPVPPTYMHFLDNGQQDYQRFIDYVERVAGSRAVPFWQTTPLRLIREEGWWDYTHLTTKGALVFSEWLGEELGRAVVHGMPSRAPSE